MVENNGFSWIELIIHAVLLQKPVKGLCACRLRSGSSCVQRTVEVAVPRLIHSHIFTVFSEYIASLPLADCCKYYRGDLPGNFDILFVLLKYYDDDVRGLFEENCIWERLNSYSY